MPILSAENSFRQGLEALIDQNYVDAAMYFRRAIDIEHQRRVLQPDMRYLSYYGLCRAKAHGQIQQALHACKRAVTLRFDDPEMYLNLGRVHLCARQRRNALDVFRQGLEVAPDHRILGLEVKKLERVLPARVVAGKKSGLLSRMKSAWSRPLAASR